MNNTTRYLRIIREMAGLLEETQARLDSQEPRQGGAVPTHTKYMTAAEYCRKRRVLAPEIYAEQVESKARRISTQMGACARILDGKVLFTEEVLSEAFSD